MIVLRLPDGDVLVLLPDGGSIRVRPDGSTVPPDALKWLAHSPRAPRHAVLRRTSVQCYRPRD